jgi:hypothetical protein
MNTLTNKIDELEEKNKKLEGENKILQRKINVGEGEICNLIKGAIDKIVKGESNGLNKFKDESLIKISEIITDKKAYNIANKELKAIVQDISIKKKEYILLYIKSEGMNSNMVIDHYEYEAKAQSQLTNPIVYIVYIKDGDKILQIDNMISHSMITGKTITIPQQDISTNIMIKLDIYKLNNTYERIKARNNEINNKITIKII